MDNYKRTLETLNWLEFSVLTKTGKGVICKAWTRSEKL